MDVLFVAVQQIEIVRQVDKRWAAGQEILSVVLNEGVHWGDREVVRHQHRRDQMQVIVVILMRRDETGDETMEMRQAC